MRSLSHADGQAEDGKQPDRRGGGEADDPVPGAEEGPCSQEADAADNGAEERERIVGCEMDGGQRQRAGSERQEDETPEPDRFSEKLANEAKAEGRDERNEEAKQNAIDTHFGCV